MGIYGELYNTLFQDTNPGYQTDTPDFGAKGTYGQLYGRLFGSELPSVAQQTATQAYEQSFLPPPEPAPIQTSPTAAQNAQRYGAPAWDAPSDNGSQAALANFQQQHLSGAYNLPGDKFIPPTSMAIGEAVYQGENEQFAQTEQVDRDKKAIKTLANYGWGQRMLMGVLSAGANRTAEIQRLTGNQAAADETYRRVGAIEQALGQIEQEEGRVLPDSVLTGISGATRSLIDAYSVSKFGTGAIIADAAISRSSEALTEAKDAGLSGRGQLAYAGTQGMIEGGITALFMRGDFGGLESAVVGKQIANQTMKQAAKKLGKGLAGEFAEEAYIAIGDAVTKKLMDVDPNSLDKDRLAADLRQTAVSVAITMGTAHAINKFAESPTRKNYDNLPAEVKTIGPTPTEADRSRLAAELSAKQLQAPQEPVAEQPAPVPPADAGLTQPPPPTEGVQMPYTEPQTLPQATAPPQDQPPVQQAPVAPQGQVEAPAVEQPVGIPELARMSESEVRSLPPVDVQRLADEMKLKTKGLTPEGVLKRVLRVKPEPYSVEAMQKHLELTAEEAAAVDMLATAQGLGTDNLYFGGGVKGLRDTQRGVFQLRGNVAIIRGLKSPTVATAIHEILGHGTRQFLFDRALAPEQRAGITDEDMTTVEEWSGAKDGDWNRAAEERFARGMEKYLSTGTAPTTALQNVFQKVADWFRGIYGFISQNPNFKGIHITPEVKDVFDRLYQRGEQPATTSPIEQRAAETGQQFGPVKLAEENAPVEAVQRVIPEVSEAAQDAGVDSQQLQSIVDRLYNRDMELYNDPDQQRHRELRKRFFRALNVMQEGDHDQVLRFDEDAQEQGFEDGQAFADYLRREPVEKPVKKNLVKEAMNEFSETAAFESAPEDETSFNFGANAFFQKLDAAERESFGYATEEFNQADAFFRGLLEQGGDLYQTAYHGSPYRFDKFTLEHIGSGEGAQAYGHGLYFAGNQDVAKFYRDKLTEHRGASPKDVAGRLYQAQPKGLKDSAKRKRVIEELEKRKAGSQDAEFQKSMDAAIASAKTDSFSGALYKVDLAPKQDEYLLWDKSLSEQSEKVKAAIGDVVSWLKSDPNFGGSAIREIDSGSITGQKLYRVLGGEIGIRSQSAPSDKGASQRLHELGIRGIKYLDGSSRGQGEGHHNYVIFDDADITIEEIDLTQEDASDKFVQNGVTVGLKLYDDGNTRQNDWMEAFKAEYGDALMMAYNNEKGVNKYLRTVWKASAEGRAKIQARNKTVSAVGKAASGKPTNRQTSTAVKAQGKLQPAKEVASDERKLLDIALKREQRGARKGYYTGTIDQQSTANELAEAVGDLLPKSERGRAIGYIVRARTPKQKAAAVDAINSLATAHNWRVAKKRLTDIKSEALKSKYLSESEIDQVRSLVDSIAFTKPTDDTIRRASALLEAVQNDQSGQIPQWRIDKARQVIERVTTTVPIQEMTPADLQAVADEIEGIIKLRLRKNQIRARGAAEAANKIETDLAHAAIQWHGRDYAGKHAPLQDTDEKRGRSLLEATKDTLTFDQQNNATLVKNVWHDNKSAQKVFVDAPAEADRQSHRVLREGRSKLRGVIEKSGLTEAEIAELGDVVTNQKLGKPLNRKSKVKAWKVPGHTSPLQLTTAEVMSLYAHFNDKQTRAELLRNKQQGIVVSRSQKSTPAKLDINDYTALFEQLPDTHKKLAMDIQRVINENHAENVVPYFWDVFGTRIENREDHFPRRRRRANEDAAQGALSTFHHSSLKNIEKMGLFKERSGGNDPIVIDDIFGVAFSQISAAATLQKSEATNNVRIVLKSSKVQDAVKSGMKNGQKYLDAFDYIFTQFAGLETPESTLGERFLNKVRRNVAIYGLGGKIHVWLYQPISLMSATNVMSWRHLLGATTAGVKSGEVAEEIAKHSDKLANRFDGQGHYIANPNYTGQMVQRFYGRGDSWVDKTMAPISYMDRWAITRIWEAVKLEGKEKGLSGDKLMEYTSKRAEEVVDATQPTWDALTSSLVVQKGRRDVLLGMMTMFTSQRQKNANLAMQAAIDLQRSDKQAADWVDASRKILVPTLFQAALITMIKEGFWDGFASLFGTDDDDEDKMDRAGDQIVRNTVGNWVVGGDVAFDIYSIGKGAVMGGRPTEVHKSPPAQLMESVAYSTYYTGKTISSASSGEIERSGPSVGQKKAIKHAERATTESLKAIGLSFGLPTGVIAQALRPFFDGADKFANPHVQRIWVEGSLYESFGTQIRDIENGIKPGLIDDVPGMKKEMAAREMEHHVKKSLEPLWNDYRKAMIAGETKKASAVMSQMETRAEAFTAWKDGKGKLADALGPDYSASLLYTMTDDPKPSVKGLKPEAAAAKLEERQQSIAEASKLVRELGVKPDDATRLFRDYWKSQGYKIGTPAYGARIRRLKL